MIYYKLTKVPEAISQLLEAERAFNELETCGILDYGVIFNRCILHCIAALEILEKQSKKEPNILSNSYRRFKNDNEKKTCRDDFCKYFNEARNAYLHSGFSCIELSDNPHQLSDSCCPEFLEFGIKAAKSRFNERLHILPSLELRLGSYVSLRPVPKKKEGCLAVLPTNFDGHNLKQLNPKQCLGLLLITVGDIVCEAHEISAIGQK